MALKRTVTIMRELFRVAENQASYLNLTAVHERASVGGGHPPKKAEVDTSPEIELKQEKEPSETLMIIVKLSATHTVEFYKCIINSKDKMTASSIL